MKFGVSYYPELVEETEWARDLENMRAAGLSVVRMAEFAWSAMEPREGEYRFEWLDRFLDLAHARGLEVVLGTPTAAPPTWLITQYPSMLVELRNGDRLTFGERREACANSTIYREYSAEIVRRMGERYGRHPAVIGWQIDNELIGPEIGDRFECHCPDCVWRFRRWLKRRYASVDEVNRAWGLGFWSMAFGDWGEVPTPRCGRTVQGLVLDFFRFYNDSIVEYLKLQVDALRAVISPRQFISHNSTGIFDRTMNHRDLARVLDVTGWDAYRGAAANVHPSKDAFTGLAHDLFRAALNKPFWIFETNPTTAITPSYIAEMRARGATGVIFWHWRRHRANLEQTALALCDQAGRPHADMLNLIAGIREGLSVDAELPERIAPRQAAVVFAAGLQAGGDAVPAADEPRAGGDRPRVRGRGRRAAGLRENRAQGPARRVLSHPRRDTRRRVRFHDRRGQPRAARHARGPDGRWRRFRAEPGYERIFPRGAKVLGTFAGCDVDGCPAVLEHRFGKGQVLYAACLSEPLFRALAVRAAREAGLPIWEHPFRDVTVVPHLAGQGVWFINHGTEPRTVDGVEVAAGSFKLIEG